MMDYWTLLAPFIQEKLRAYQLRRSISRCGKSLIRTSTPQEQGWLDASPRFALAHFSSRGSGEAAASTQNSGAVISNGVVRLKLESLFDVRQ
jgi:hypothetical protein